MTELTLFQVALGLTPPCQSFARILTATPEELTIDIDFPRASRLSSPQSGRAECPVYDLEPKGWRHLNFWQNETVLSAGLPPGSGARTARCSRWSCLWAVRAGGFTVWFEALVLVVRAEAAPAATGNTSLAKFGKSPARSCPPRVSDSPSRNPLRAVTRFSVRGYGAVPIASVTSASINTLGSSRSPSRSTADPLPARPCGADARVPS
jgi:hypothetical protein